MIIIFISNSILKRLLKDFSLVRSQQTLVFVRVNTKPTRVLKKEKERERERDEKVFFLNFETTQKLFSFDLAKVCA